MVIVIDDESDISLAHGAQSRLVLAELDERIGVTSAIVQPCVIPLGQRDTLEPLRDPECPAGHDDNPGIASISARRWRSSSCLSLVDVRV